MVTHEDNQGVFGVSVDLECGEQITDPGIKTRDTVVVIGSLFEELGGIAADERGWLYFTGRLGVGGAPVGCANEWEMGVREVDGEIPRLIVGLAPEFTGRSDVVGHRGFPIEIGSGDRGVIEGEGALGIDVEFAHDAGAITAGLQVGHNVGRVRPVEFETMGREADVAVLMRIESGERAGP